MSAVRQICDVDGATGQEVTFMTSAVRRLLVGALKRTHLHRAARRLRAAASPAFRQQKRRMLTFYQQFVQPGELAFDVGANIGNRTEVLLELGARVVAIEPQEACVNELRRRFGSNPNFTLITDAVGSEEGEGELMIADESTVSSMASEWVDRVKDTGRFGDIEWRRVERVRTTTLDALIRRYGLPVFCKIDVEGYEPVVLNGLTQRVPALSFEFTPEFLEGAIQSVEHLGAIGYRNFNYSPGESLQFQLQEWVSPNELLSLLREAPAATFGDVYAK